jgi:MscS family membrane protein
MAPFRVPRALILVAALLTLSSGVGDAAPAQAAPAVPAQAAPPAPGRTTTPNETLGRETPRGTLYGFIDAARKGNADVAALYLNTPLRDRAAAELASQLYVVLDARLPARLPALSDRPEGSLANPLKPNQDVLGTIVTDTGTLDILVERVTRGPAGPVWLFSRRTLDAIPEVYEQVHLVSVDRFLPPFLTRPRVAGIRLFDWLAFFIVLPIVYAAGGLLKPILVVPPPARLFVLAVAIRWLVRSLDLPLVERQFWTSTATMLLVGALVWLGFLLTRAAEIHLLTRLDRRAFGDAQSLLRLGRRTVDVLVFVAGGFVVLHYYGVDATAALAGLGIGGIAVALSAQKTLENVIGGVSIIFDGAVRVGDFLKLGTTIGSVEYVGLRSTLIRTLDRTRLSIPNGLIATLNIERLSDRDKFWFHHIVGVIYGTSADQLRAITGEIRELLRHSRGDDSSIRVRVVRFAASSLEIEIAMYLFAQNWDHFLELQEDLLLEVMQIVEAHGSAIAFPTQTVHVEAAPVLRGLPVSRS